jgi:hypothetical protein
MLIAIVVVLILFSRLVVSVMAFAVTDWVGLLFRIEVVVRGVEGVDEVGINAFDSAVVSVASMDAVVIGGGVDTDETSDATSD